MKEKRIFKDPAQLAQAFTDFLLEEIGGQSDYHLALSGGSTPKALFQMWSAEHASKKEWHNVHFYWGDERCVPPADPQSNYGVANELFFHHFNSHFHHHHVHRMKGEDDPQKEAKRYGDLLLHKLDQDGGWPVFDMIILGMGTDGHTASIFPHESHLISSGDVCAVATHPESGQNRVTLTGEVLRRARKVVFLVTGASKTEKINAIWNVTDDSAQYPATWVHQHAQHVIWYMDEAAAGE